MEENELFEDLHVDNDQTDDVQEKPAKVRKTAADFFRPIQISPEVTKQTLGIESDHITPKLLMAASKRVLGIARGEEQSDDRDSLQFQRVYGSSEYLPEHIQKDGGKVARNILWKATNRGNLDFLSAGALEPHVDSVFNESKLAQYIDGTNMFESIDANTKITRIGEGGIGDQRMAPDEMRQINNSFLGFVDSLRFPECTTDRHQVLTTEGWVNIADVTESHKVACLIDGKFEYHHPERVIAKDYEGTIYSFTNKRVSYEVTPNHRMWTKGLRKSARIKKSGGFQKEYNPDFGFEEASSMHNRGRNLQGGGHVPYEVDDPITVFSPKGSILTYDIDDWCEFMGWYVSEGSYLHNPKHNYEYKNVYISQVKDINPDNYSSIENLLNRMGVHYTKDARGFCVREKAIRDHIEPLGYCQYKYITDEVWNAPLAAQRKFIDAMMAGDGRKPRKGSKSNAGYTTTSPRLAEDMDRLLIQHGYATSVRLEQDDRKEYYLDNYVVRPLHRNTYQLCKNGSPITDSDKRSEYYTQFDYVGKVYCLTVPGGIFYTRIKGYSGFWTGNSLRIGLDSFMSKNTRKGSDGKLYTRMTDARTGKEKWVDSVTLARANVATAEYAPGEAYGDDKFVPIPRSHKGIVSYVPRNKIDYYATRSDELLSLAANTVPYVSGIKEMRAMLGSKHFASTVPLDNPETPWVSVKDPDTGGPIEAKLGNLMGARRAAKPGVVTAVRKDRVDVQYKDGTKESFELYQNYPNNQKGFINSTPLVKAGDTFDAGQMLARTNFTNDKGEAANGVNLRTAFVSWKGMNYEDAKVISDYAAKKLASTTMYKSALDLDKSIKLGKANYLGMRPGEYSKEQMDSIGDNGLVKVGTTVSKGDPLYVGVRIVPPSPGSFGKRQFEDITETWEHDHPGIVTDVVQTKKGLKVFVKSSAPVAEGDKLSNFAGMKGVVAAVIPRDQMPKDENGDPIDVLESPLGIISRTNSAFSTVMLLSEIARKRKQPYYVDNFPKEDINEFALSEAKKYNVSPTRTLTDPETGRKIKNVQVGSMFVYKQKHMSEGKESARGTSGYNAEDIPSRGGYEGCLHGSTKVTTEDGTLTIREIVKGKLTPKVLSYNVKKASWEYNKVTDWFAYKVPMTRLHKYELEGGIYTLYATGNHQVYDNFGEKAMFQDYEIGDRIAVYAWDVSRRAIPSRKLKAVSSIPTDKEYVIVYDITVENVHNYVANNILVSNSKRIGNMETAALVSHQVWDVLKDAKLVRGQSNQDFWRTIRTGEIPSMPREPIVYQKFYNHLKAAGVNIKRTDTGLKVFALTDKEAKNLTGARELNSTDTFDANDYTPIKGGMFGVDIFGPEGTQWGYIKLDEPLPNPVMEEPLRRILRMTQKDFEAIISGNQQLNGLTGGKAIQQALSKINLKQELADARQEFKTSTKSKKDEALKRYIELSRMDKQGTHPSEFMLTRIPVLPAKYRPVMSSGGLTMVSDTNYLYKQMLEARDDLRSVQDLPDEVQGEARSGIYRAWRELTGIVEPSAPKLKQKAVKGLLRWVLGTSPKTSAVMQKLVTSTVDTVGRGVIAPDPALKLDEIGLPKSVAFEVYKPFVTRALVNMNYTPLEAMKQVDKQTPVATDVLMKVMEKRPVIFNRAPTLHKFSMMGYKPRITAGHIIRVNPSTVGPAAADFDGDQANIHVPVSDAAVREVYEKMLPQRNLLSVRKHSIQYPLEKEYRQGIYLASRMKSDKAERTVDSLTEAIRMYNNNEIDIDTPIEIRHK